MAQKTDIRLRNLRTYLERYMADLERATEDRIKAPRTRRYPSGKVINSPINASGELLSNIYVDSDEDDDSISFSLNVPDYGVDLNEGEQLTPSTDDLVDWLRVKGIRPTNSKGKFMKISRAAYLIKRSISDYGSPAAPFIDEALEISAISARQGFFIANAVKEDLQEQIQEALLESGYKMSGTGDVASFEIEKPN